MKKGVYVFDFDDVLVDHAIDLYHCIRSHWRIYNRWFKDLGPLTKEELAERKFFRLNEWLIKDEFRQMTPEEYAALQLQITASFRKDFYMFPCYNKSVPTLLAQRTLMNKLFTDSENVSAIFILSKNITETQRESKMEFISKWFNHPKIEFLNVNQGESKAKVLKEYGVDWNLIVDDEIPNIRNLAESYSSLEGKEFLIPEFGYNKMPPELEVLIQEKGGSYSYYDPYQNKEEE